MFRSASSRCATSMPNLRPGFRTARCDGIPSHVRPTFSIRYRLANIDQASSASSEDYLGATSPAPSDAMVADETDVLEDYQSSVLEDDVMGGDVDATVLPDLDDVERPENL